MVKVSRDSESSAELVSVLLKMRGWQQFLGLLIAYIAKHKFNIPLKIV